MRLMTISEFSDACGLSVPTIRRYGRAGMLRPARVEERTGYRWYAPDQVPTAVLIRTLRELSVPLADVQAILEEADPVARLARIEQHWLDVEREVASGRRMRDHLARILGGWQEIIAGYRIEEREVQELPVLLRRRRVHLLEVPGLVVDSVERLRVRAAAEGRTVLGFPVAVYRWPVGHEDGEDDGGEGDRDVEVCLPVSGDGDALLPGGRLVTTEATGDDGVPPRLLTAYGAVSQWAHEQHQVLTGPPLEIHLGAGRLRVGWLVRSPAAPDIEAEDGGEHEDAGRAGS